MEYHQIHEIININLIDLMINEGYNPNAYDKYGLTPLHYCEDPVVAKFLIEKGANPTIPSNDDLQLSPIETCENTKVKNIFLSYLFSNIV